MMNGRKQNSLTIWLSGIGLGCSIFGALQAFMFPRLGNPLWAFPVLTLLAAGLFIDGIRGKKIETVREEDADEFSKLNRQELAQQMLRTQAQMASLQSQINPHFLYNTLESIRSKALIHDENEIADMVEALAHLFRYNIGKGDISATLTQELNNVQNYLTIQNYRFRNKFHLEVDLEGTGDLADQYQIPVLTLQPIVENAIHYGLEKKIGEGHIFLRAYQTQRNFIVEIRDDGVGMTAEEVANLREKINGNQSPAKSGSGRHGSGIALPNVNKRLKLFFGDDSGLEIISAKDVGTQVSIVMPREPVSLKENRNEI